MATVTGKIIFPAGASFSGATVYIRVSKTGMMDAPAPVVAEQTKNNVSSSDRVDFSLNVPTVEDRERYSVSAHVSMDGSDDYKKGDYVTKSDYAVLTHDAPSQIDVRVESV